MAYYYRKRHPDYHPLPPFRADCQSTNSIPMQFIYPENGTTFYIPRGLDSMQEEIVFQLTHARPSTKIFWHMDGNYLGFTRNSHKLALRPGTGKHKINVIDESGNTLSLNIEILSR